MKDFQKIHAIIQEFCPNNYRLMEENSIWLYHGSKNPRTFKVIQTKDTRKPRDVNKKSHSLISEYWPFVTNRNNSLFVTSNSNIADSYGDEIYNVIPFDDAHYCWSPKINDFANDFKSWLSLVDFESLHDDLNRLKKMIVNEQNKEPVYPDSIMGILKKFLSINENDYTAIRELNYWSGPVFRHFFKMNKSRMNFDEFPKLKTYFSNKDSFDVGYAEKLFQLYPSKDRTQKAIKALFKNDDLLGALNSGNEIMLRGKLLLVDNGLFGKYLGYLEDEEIKRNSK